MVPARSPAVPPAGLHRGVRSVVFEMQLRWFGFLLALFVDVNVLDAALPPSGTYSFFDHRRPEFGGTNGTLTITSSGAFTGQIRPLLPLYVLPPGPIWFRYWPYIHFRGEFDEAGMLLPG